MQPWCRIAARRSDMDGIDKPVKSIRVSPPAPGAVIFVRLQGLVESSLLNAFQSPAKTIVKLRAWVLPQRSNHLGIPLPI